MSLLSLEHVSKRNREGQRERVVLDDVSLEIEVGELVGVSGPRRSGRTTLMRVAAGLEAPDSGVVRFRGDDLRGCRERVLGAGIGYVSKTLRASEERGVLEQVAVGLLARGIALNAARESARTALEKTGASDCAGMYVGELDGAEALRVAVARALALSPPLLVVDEPTATVGLAERDGILRMLRDLGPAGTAVLVSSGAPEELAGFDRVLSLAEGRVYGQTEAKLAPVVALRGHAL